MSQTIRAKAMYFIYFIKVAENIKIGRCLAQQKTLMARLKEAKRWYPESKLLSLLIVKDKAVEHLLHNYFHSYCVQSEVFTLNENLKTFIKEETHWCQSRTLFYAKEWDMLLSGKRLMVSYLSNIKYKSIKDAIGNLLPPITFESFVDQHLQKYISNNLDWTLETIKKYFYSKHEYKMIDVVSQLIEKQENQMIEENNFTGIDDNGFYYVDGEFCMTDPLGIEAY